MKFELSNGKLDLHNCLIVFSSDDEPSYVHQAVSDFQNFVERHAGVRPKIAAPGEPTYHHSPIILAGKIAADSVADLSGWLPANVNTEQGMVFKTATVDGKDYVIAAGADAHGSAFAIIELVKAIKFNDGQTWLDAPIDLAEKPYHKVRGIYAHQHWAFNYPWALRSWKFDDWRRYIDLLAYMKINFFQIWSMAGICPVPLSKGDREYLENYQRVIEYAKERRGMEVWIGECANNVAETDKGQKIQERDYFSVEALKNPADPAQFAEIMQNREQFYQIADNADGYWIIDSDPGGWEGSPSSEFVDILVGNRDLIDKYTIKGKEAKLTYWVWFSWGTKDGAENRAAVIDGTSKRIHEPWELLACDIGHLAIAKEKGYLSKTIFFPYARAEDEPSTPTTRIRFTDLAKAFQEADDFPGIRGIMANCQTPLAQLPNIFFFAESAWHGCTDQEPKIAPILEKLARCLFRDNWHEIADAWRILHEGSEYEADKMAVRLEVELRDGLIGAPNELGMYVSPDHTIIVSSLVKQLRIRARARHLIEELSAEKPFSNIAPALRKYFAAILDWHKMHGFSRFLNYGPDVWNVQKAWKEYSAKSAPRGDEMQEVSNKLVGNSYQEVWIKHLIEKITPTSGML